MGFLARIKSSYFFTSLEVGKYTKRRRSNSTEFESRDSDFYRKNYVHGEYLHRLSEQYGRCSGEETEKWVARRQERRRCTMCNDGMIRSSEMYNEVVY